MNEKIRVLIADDNLPFCSLCCSLLEGYGFAPAAFNGGPSLSMLIGDLKPHVLVLNLMLLPGGASAFLKKLGGDNGRLPCRLLLLSPVDCGLARGELLKLGADDFFLLPCDLDMLMERIIKLAAPPAEGYSLPLFMRRDDHNLERRVCELLYELGVPAHIKGRFYLLAGITLAGHSPELLLSVTKQLYPAIAHRFGGNAQQIERAIRLAISRAHNIGDKSAYLRCFGDARRPTNLSFIAGAVEYLRRTAGTGL